MGKLLRVCENCNFRVEQINIDNGIENICILSNKHIGLLCYCNKYKTKTGEHITKD